MSSDSSAFGDNKNQIALLCDAEIERYGIEDTYGVSVNRPLTPDLELRIRRIGHTASEYRYALGLLETDDSLSSVDILSFTGDPDSVPLRISQTLITSQFEEIRTSGVAYANAVAGMHPSPAGPDEVGSILDKLLENGLSI